MSSTVPVFTMERRHMNTGMVKLPVSIIRVFGCLAYVFVPKSQRDALDSHTDKCIFVGYPSDCPGWVFWNPQTRKIIHSDSAVSDERVFPGTSLAKESIPNLSDYVQLPDLEEATVYPSSIPPPNPHPAVHVAGRPVLHLYYLSLHTSLSSTSTSSSAT
ncbi:SubName: Full=Uncharacterized protein {ECO:0000313/EMBL:CCA75805.1} [Serendipita indica DSM 11827]|nr:SubName: Full=Uncharacterized protein {ECO:0000313/EMBL:CCA75805.1} [Serendipita indica DSM 11827]